MGSAQPSVMPPAVKLAMEQAANWKMFQWRKIVPSGLENAPEPNQYTEYTTETAKWIGKKFAEYAKPRPRTVGGAVVKAASSPLRIEHAVDTMAGPMWVDAVAAIEGIIDASDDNQGEWNPSDMLILGGLFKRGGPMGIRSQSVDKAYTLYGDAMKNYYDKTKEETSDERHRRLLLSDATKALTELGKIRTLLKSESERRDVTEEMVRISKDAISEYEKEGTALRGPTHSARKRAEARRKQLASE